jgi:hypothetical protein
LVAPVVQSKKFSDPTGAVPTDHGKSGAERLHCDIGERIKARCEKKNIRVMEIRVEIVNRTDKLEVPGEPCGFNLRCQKHGVPQVIAFVISRPDPTESPIPLRLTRLEKPAGFNKEVKTFSERDRARPHHQGRTGSLRVCSNECSLSPRACGNGLGRKVTVSDHGTRVQLCRAIHHHRRRENNPC